MAFDAARASIDASDVAIDARSSRDHAVNGTTDTRLARRASSAQLKAAGITVRGRGRPGTGSPRPAISEGVSTDSAAGSVTTQPGRAPAASACEPYRDLIEEALGRGRNAVAIYQDLVTDHGFPARYANVGRFVVKLRGSTPAEARVVITTAPGEEAKVDYRWPAPRKLVHLKLD